MMIFLHIKLVLLGLVFYPYGCNNKCTDNATLRIINLNKLKPGIEEGETKIGSPSTKWYYFTKPQQLQMVCTARYPIDILIDGKMPSLITTVRFERSIKKYSDNSTYCYKIYFEVKPNYKSTGNYTCKSTNCGPSCWESSSIFIFINDESGPVLLNHELNGKSINIPGDPDSFGLLTIPCILTNPNEVPKLYKMTNKKFNDLKELSLSKEIHYSKFKGFLINALFMEYSKEYVCKFGKTQHLIVSIAKDINNSTFYRAKPSSYIPGSNAYDIETLLYFNRKENIELTCESNVPVYILTEPNPNWKNNLRIETLHNNNSFYKYFSRIKGEIDANDTKQEFRASCWSASRELQVWKYKSIPEGSYKEWNSVTIDNNDEDYPISCKGLNVNDQAKIWIIECEDELNCQIADKFSFMAEASVQKSIYPFRVIRGNTCIDIKSSKTDPKPACISHKLGRNRGIIKCIIDLSNKKTLIINENFIIGFNNTIITEFLDHRRVTKGLRMTLMSETSNKTYYLGGKIRVQCDATPAIYSNGIQVAFKLEDGTFLFGSETSTLKYHGPTFNNGYITMNATVKLESLCIIEVYCFAPYWNSPKWGNVSVKIKVEGGEYPKIIKPDNMQNKNGQEDNIVTFAYGASNRSLECLVSGIPTPTVTWYKDNEPITAENDKVLRIEWNGNASKLFFNDIMGSHSGHYKCEATNDKGNDSMIFTVQLEESSTILIVIIVSSGVAFIAISIIVYWYFRNKLDSEQRASNYLTEIEIMEFHHGNEDLRKKYAELNDCARYLPYKHDFEIPRDKLDLDEDNLLGSGAFGMVLRGILNRHGQNVTVAVKTVKSSAHIQELRTLLSEIKIMMYIEKHRNIVELIGAITKELREGKLYVIVEYCSNGNLQTVLRNSRATFINQIHKDSHELDFNIDNADELNARKSQFRAVSWKIEDFDLNDSTGRSNSLSKSYIKTKDLIQWANQVTEGMEYLVEKKVVHGDLACRNLLLNHDWIIKITDFGLSNHLYEYTNYIKKRREEPVPWRWLSIEAIKDSKFSVFSDVWAFGITLWEIFSLAETPYQGFSWGNEFVQELNQGYRLPSPGYATNQIYQTMLKCWDSDVGKRPSFTELKEVFTQILLSTPNNNPSTSQNSVQNTLSVKFT